MEEPILIEIHNQLTKSYQTNVTSNTVQKRILEKDIIIFLNDYRKVLLPEYIYNREITLQELINFKKLLHNILELTKYSNCLSEEDTMTILGKIPTIKKMVNKDIEAAFIKDPAAKSYEEVAITYPGLFAIMVHRFSHELYKLGYFFFSRLLSEYSHSKTGIDIHPGATIGESFFIDHGTGIVIGETTMIGNNVTIYQNVTLGAFSFHRDDNGNIIKGLRRHPTIEDNVTVYAGATILGGETIIGRDSIIGGNAWLTESVLPNSKVVSKFENKIYYPQNS
ncbi:serine acetyltransferase [Neobacillus drentensis]|uniref:serine O-acetyltransferase EpsC n=1 Tax=Neobacillus drentensis TaxID=220684 RepID=UPI001F463A41|nr:serine O-acetyltransferase EpsC [Neobacillus drentensis]ULT56195.1 serine acetyltransferase [Neobacillus drentensis]